MKKTITAGLMAFVFCFASASHASVSDYVDAVYPCGDDVGIKMQNNGWVVATLQDLGPERVDQILSVAMSLFTSGQKGSFTESQTLSKWCGIKNVKSITALKM